MLTDKCSSLLLVQGNCQVLFSIIGTRELPSALLHYWYMGTANSLLHYWYRGTAKCSSPLLVHGNCQMLFSIIGTGELLTALLHYWYMGTAKCSSPLLVQGNCQVLFSINGTRELPSALLHYWYRGNDNCSSSGQNEQHCTNAVNHVHRSASNNCATQQPCVLQFMITSLGVLVPPADLCEKVTLSAQRIYLLIVLQTHTVKACCWCMVTSVTCTSFFPFFYFMFAFISLWFHTTVCEKTATS